MTNLPALTTREVYQVLKDGALELHPVQRRGSASSSGLIDITLNGWHLTLDFAGNQLHHCERCRSPDGREAEPETWQRYGTNPVNLLSTWELAQWERLLASLV